MRIKQFVEVQPLTNIQEYEVYADHKHYFHK